MYEKENNNITNDKIFEVLDFYMLRAPVLPIEIYIDFFESIKELNKPEDIMSKLESSHFYSLFKEALAVSSPSLVNSLSNFKCSKNKDQIIKSALRYLNRMTTRTTPFGIFSGVSIGQFAEYSEITLDSINSYRKRARPDMEWLLKVINNLESDINVVEQLVIQTNMMLYESGSRVKLPFKTVSEKDASDRDIDTPSISNTAVVAKTLKIAKNPIRFRDLMVKIHSDYPDQPIEIIRQFLWTMLKNDFFISELRSPLTNPNPIKYLIDKLNNLFGMEGVRNKLVNLSERLDKLNNLELGSGYNYTMDLINEMKSVYDVKNPLQVDLSINNINAKLNHSIKEEIERAAVALLKLSPQKVGMPHLVNYKTEFLEVYGVDREIPILELLDEDIGLGAPPTYKHPEGWIENKNNHLATNRYSILLQWLENAIITGNIEVQLTDSMINQLNSLDNKLTQAPLSMELYFNIVANSKSDVDSGRYQLILGANPGSDGAGKTFGRFVDILDNRINVYLNDIHNKEKKLEPDIIFAELQFQHAFNRVANVVISPNKRDYEIPLGTNSSKEKNYTLPLSDLLIGYEDGKFYVKSKRLNKRVIPTVGNMLNYHNTPNIYRFLNEISNEGRLIWSPQIWGELNESPFLPRLRYGRTILHLARWRLGVFGK